MTKKITMALMALGMMASLQAQDSLKIIFAGDLMGHGGQIKAALIEEGKYDYTPCFRFIAPYLQSANLAIANFELTLAGPPYKGYPQFSSPDQLLVDASNAGFDIFTTVNNHCMDGGKRGFLRTLKVFDSLGVPHLGTYRNAAERAKEHPMMVERNGFRLALVTYTYGTNGLPVLDPLVVNMIDTMQMKADLARAKELGADIAIYGHIHMPDYGTEDGVLVINPGSVAKPRQEGWRKSYAVMMIGEDVYGRLDPNQIKGILEKY